MSIFKPFRGYRPAPDNAAKIASRPYDVLTSVEAKKEAGNNPLSFLRVIKPEIDLPDGTSLYAEEVYQKGKENLQKLIHDDILKQDENPCYYVYAQTMCGKIQYGLMGCSGVEDYKNDIIKKHELTRPDKEDDRTKHVKTAGFNQEPVFFTYHDNEKIDNIVSKTVQPAPVYDFEAEDGIRHQVWVIDDQEKVGEIETIFKNEVAAQYVADGHHRTAAAARVGTESQQANPNHTGNEEYNFFLSVLFPASQLTIIDYNRVVKDLNGMDTVDFLNKLENSFEVENKGVDIYKPNKVHTFSMYLGGNWYKLVAKPGVYNDDDPIGCLDVTVLSKYVLEPLLDIQDLRKSKRIDFVGGIRGLRELEKRVDEGDMKVAFALYPVTMKQLMRIADTGNIMPPKTTWFEPKLRSGLVLHDLEIN